MAHAESKLLRYADLLAGPGIERGLMGPREGPRIWERHILNCSVVADPTASIIPEDASIVDIGSGAGLPGITWALTRPDVRVRLVEPTLRRSDFLLECVETLGLDSQVEVTRARAEDLAIVGLGVNVVTARAVAPLGQLARLAHPLLGHGGRLVALKGRSASEELARDQDELTRQGFNLGRVETAGHGVVDPPTTVVIAEVAAA